MLQSSAIARDDGETDMCPRGDAEQIAPGDLSQISNRQIRAWLAVSQKPPDIAGSAGRLVSGYQQAHAAAELPDRFDDGLGQENRRDIAVIVEEQRFVGRFLRA